MVLVNMLGALFVAVGVIEDELMVLDVLGDSVDFNLGFVHLDAWVEAAHCIDFTIRGFFIEERSLTHAHADVHTV